MTWEEWERLPRPPGWKCEYYDGKAPIRPNGQYAVTTIAVARRAVSTPCELRPIVQADERQLLPV